VNERDLFTASLKLEWYQDYGTFTSITAYDDLEELLTGDQFNFLPRDQALYNFIPFGDFIKAVTGDEFADLSQTQFLDTDSWSQEVRFASPAENRLRWIAGAYGIWTDRFISTGNQIDRGNGVFPVYYEPRPFWLTNPTDPSPQLGLLADAQDNFAWAVFGDVSYDVTDTVEASFSLRYDKDTRENTTLTEQTYDPTCPGPAGCLTTFGEVRKESWDSWQPKFVLRWQPTDNSTYYGSYSRGFRSGGFNQSGVGEAVVEPGVDDIFPEQIADTFEVGGKWTFDGGRYALGASIYTTDFDNAYFFFFDPDTSTQNLGSIPNVRYNGFELEGNAQFTDNFDAYLGIGYTDGEIREAADPADVGNQAPLVSEYTINAGGTYRIPLSAFGGSEIVLRADYQRIGDTWWDPGNISVRSPIDLLDLRAGLELPDNWSLTLWVKNATDEIYNAEFSPGPAEGANFLWPALPRQWGATFIKQF
jgi:iron complex outermembrane receptor protein